MEWEGADLHGFLLATPGLGQAYGVGRPVGRLDGRVHAYGPLHKDLGAHDLVPKAVQVLFC